MRSFPWPGMSEVETVTIPLAEYRHLLDCRRQLTEANVRQRSFDKPPASPIERDPEIAVFIASRLGTWTIEQIRDQCTKAFGPTRTPSRSAVSRYWARLRAPQKAP